MELPVVIDRQSRRRALLRVDNHADRYLFARLRIGRRYHALKIDLVAMSVLQGHYVDRYAVRPCPPRLGDQIAYVVVAVRHEHDALGRVVGKHGHRQANGRRHVGAIGVLHLRQPTGWQIIAAAHRHLLKVRVPGKINQSHAIVSANVPGRLADELLLEGLQRFDAVRSVHQEYDG